MKKIVKKLVFSTLVLFFAENVFSQDILELEREAQAQEAQAQEAQLNSEIDVLQKELSIIMSNQAFNLNPHTASYSSEAQILDALYEGLFSYDPKTLEPKPAIAESFKLSRDKKKITYKIRDNLKFSDGGDLTAFSVRDSLLMLLSTPNAPYASLLDCVKGVSEFRKGIVSEKDVGISARDNKTLVIQLTEPTAHFNKILCHHAFSVKTGADNVFSGAFVMKERTDNSILLEKNHNYWDAKNVKIPSIRINTCDEVKDNTWDFNTGKVDWISGMFYSDVLLNKRSMHLSAIFGTEYIFFSCKNSPWDNALFRNALVAAVPWTELRKGSLIAASTFIYPLANYEKVEGLTDTSIEDAIDMMKEARKLAGIDENEILHIKFGISASSERQKKFAECLKAAWAPLNVCLDIEIASGYRYIEQFPTWNADLFVYSWIGDFADPIAFLELFRENSTLNQTKWVNPEFTNLLNQSSLTTDSSERMKLLAKAENLLLEEGEVLPISHSISFHAINLNRIGGWYTNALDIHPYKYLYFKEYKDEIPNVVKNDSNNFFVRY